MDALLPSKKQRAAALLARSGLLGIRERMRGRCANLTILGYHRVLDIDPARYPYDEHIVSATPEAFDEQMAYVRANFDVLTFAEFHGLNGRSIPPRPLVITFDDGYRDNCTEALPILRRHGLRAVVYLTTGHIGGSDLFWYEKVAYWLKACDRPDIAFGADGAKLSLGEHRHATLRRIRTALKLADEREHGLIMAQLEEQCGNEFHQRDLVACLSWDEVHAMQAAGTEFGSHSVSHLNLAAVTAERLRREVEESKATIEARVGTPVVSLAYPFGQREHYNEAVEAAVRDAGYAFGVTFMDGINPIDAADNYGLRRIRLERDMDMDLFRSMLQLPKVFVRG